jgi:hypothetical protein
LAGLNGPGLGLELELARKGHCTYASVWLRNATSADRHTAITPKTTLQPMTDVGGAGASPLDSPPPGMGGTDQTMVPEPPGFGVHAIGASRSPIPMIQHILRIIISQ